jgi:hypothetical protein
MTHRIRDIDALYDFIGYVVVSAPDRFPKEDYLSDHEQMNLERAFAELRHGIALVESDFPGAVGRGASPSCWMMRIQVTFVVTKSKGHISSMTSSANLQEVGSCCLTNRWNGPWFIVAAPCARLQLVRGAGAECRLWPAVQRNR